MTPPFSFRVPIMHTLVCLLLSYKSLKLSLLFSILFSSCSSDWMNTTALPSSLLILPSTWFSLMLKVPLKFFCCYCIVQLYDFCLLLFNIFNLFVEILCSCIAFLTLVTLWLFWTLCGVNHLSPFHYPDLFLEIYLVLLFGTYSFISSFSMTLSLLVSVH